ncbi:unnamed protein product, partial [Ixodes persulcatus]
EIVNQFREPDWLEIERLMMESNDTFPRQTDLVDAGEALIRLQKTYRLNLTDLTRGIIMGHQSMAYLSGADCFYFGQLLYNKADYEHATQWFQEALTKVNFEKQPSITPRSIHSYLSSSLELRKCVNRPSYLTANVLTGHHIPAQKREPTFTFNRKFVNRPSHSSANVSTGLYTQTQTSEPAYTFERKCVNHSLHAYVPRDQAPNALCRGEKIRNASEEKDLFCLYDVPHPYFKIGPVKVEQMSKNPYVVQFYDVLWPQEIKAFRRMGDPQV